MIRRFLSHWLPPLVWMGLIFFLSAQPDIPHAPGLWLDTLIKKTGFEDKKIRNILFRASKQGKIKRAGRGMYVGA